MHSTDAFCPTSFSQHPPWTRDPARPWTETRVPRGPPSGRCASSPCRAWDSPTSSSPSLIRHAPPCGGAGTGRASRPGLRGGAVAAALDTSQRWIYFIFIYPSIATENEGNHKNPRPVASKPTDRPLPSRDGNASHRIASRLARHATRLGQPEPAAPRLRFASHRPRHVRLVVAQHRIESKSNSSGPARPLPRACSRVFPFPPRAREIRPLPPLARAVDRQREQHGALGLAPQLAPKVRAPAAGPLSLCVSLPQSSGRLALSSPIRLVEIPPVCWIHSFGCFD